MKSVIVNPTARTRAVYAWERDELMLSRLNPRFTEKDCVRFIRDFWRHEGRRGSYQPKVELTAKGDYSFVHDGKITLHVDDSGPLILAHELVHALGFGVGRSVHPVSFVKRYIDALAVYVGFERSWLEFSAMSRRLI